MPRAARTCRLQLLTAVPLLLFFRNIQPRFRAPQGVFRTRVINLRIVALQPLFRLAPLRLLPGTSLPGFDVAPDGRRFVFVQSLETVSPPAPTVIHLVENWFEELKRLVPTGKK